ncbi:MAG: hypothetical protein HHAS10_01080 [Candidatus Altimarinota bacterium]
MRKFLLFIFFLLFITILFLWDHELTGFWLDSENRNFLIREGVSWMNQFAFILDFLKAYQYPIAIIGILYFSNSFYQSHRKKMKEKEKKNVFQGSKVIYDANAILSPESLPESEKKREKARKEGPALIVKKSDKSNAPQKENPEDDLDPETMRQVLNSEKF